MIVKSLTQISLRLLIAWLLVSIFFFVGGEWILHCLLPFLSFLTNSLANNYHAELTIDDSAVGKIITIIATATEDIYRFDIPIAPKGTRVTGNGTLMHSLVPIAILFTILCAWPTTLKKYLIQLLFAFPVALLILGVTTPVLLVGHIEQVFHSAAQNYAGREISIPLIMEWVVFMEVGGIWLLPIVGAFFCIKLSAMIESFVPAKNPVIA